MGSLSNEGTAMGLKLEMGPRMGPTSVYMDLPELRKYTENMKHHGRSRKKLRNRARTTKTKTIPYRYTLQPCDQEIDTVTKTLPRKWTRT
jgi:hypothetical protein